MNEATRENVLFFLTIANLVAGAVSIALAVVASMAIREMRRMEKLLVAKPKPGTDLVPWGQRPQATVEFPRPMPRIKPSVLAENRMRFHDDLW